MDFETALKSVKDSYSDFVIGSMRDMRLTPEKRRIIIDFIRDNPDTTTSDVTVLENELVGIHRINE